MTNCSLQGTAGGMGNVGVANILMKGSMLRQSNDNTSTTDALLDSTLFVLHTWNPLFDMSVLEMAKIYLISPSKPFFKKTKTLAAALKFKNKCPIHVF